MTSNYYKPTPKKWRQLGDSLLSVGTFVGSYAAFAEMKWVAIAAFALGVVGKFLTNFFKDDTQHT